MKPGRHMIVGFAALLLWAGSAAATKPTPGQKCQAAKDRAAGRYSSCRLFKSAKAVVSATPADFSKCDAKQLTAWTKAEAKYGIACPTITDQVGIQNEVAGDAAVVAAKLAGSPLCGNGAIDPQEQCDNANLNLQTCEMLGYQGGTLACSAACVFDTSGCVCHAASVLSTGQNASFTQGGDDGGIQAGAALNYTDNGDGTITDRNTLLVWEKKVGLDGAGNVGNLHDADNCYPWSGVCAVGGDTCSVDADCGANGPCQAEDCQTAYPNGLTVFSWVAQLNAGSFGGHSDWRVPNLKELQSIVNVGVTDPAVSPALQGASCGTSCLDLASPACGCTGSGSSGYWSSTTYSSIPTYAWNVNFFDGTVFPGYKFVTYQARAVRGGM